MNIGAHVLVAAKGVGTFSTLGAGSGAWVCGRGLAMFTSLLISLNSPIVAVQSP